MTREQAKKALDLVIGKARVHLYKPIQIAEILYRKRTTDKTINLSNLEEYRIKSRHWRNDVCNVLVGRPSTSNTRYQDDVRRISPINAKGRLIYLGFDKIVLDIQESECYNIFTNNILSNLMREEYNGICSTNNRQCCVKRNH